jgi:16S rRNA (guanine527-N7)-methyltransferase
VLGVAATVHSGRADVLRNVFDCITLRAVDKMEQAVQAVGQMVRPGGWLALMTTGRELEALKAAAGTEFAWTPLVLLPSGEDQLLALGERKISLPV